MRKQSPCVRMHCAQSTHSPHLEPGRLLLGAQLAAQLLGGCGARAVLVAAAQLLQRPRQEPADCRCGKEQGQRGKTLEKREEGRLCNCARQGQWKQRRDERTLRQPRSAVQLPCAQEALQLCGHLPQTQARVRAARPRAAPTCLGEAVLHAGLERLAGGLFSRVGHLLPVGHAVEQRAQPLIAGLPQLVCRKPVGQLQDLDDLLHLRAGNEAQGAGGFKHVVRAMGWLAGAVARSGAKGWAPPGRAAARLHAR